MSQQKLLQSAAFTSAVLSHNIFELVLDSHKINGAMAAHEWVSNFAITFEENHSHIKEWQDYLLEQGGAHSDWEEYLVDVALGKLNDLENS